MVRHCVNLVLSWYILVSLSIHIQSFAEYSNMVWHFCFLRVCMMCVQDLLGLIVSVEKSAVILIDLPLYITYPFSLTGFSIVLNILCFD